MNPEEIKKALSVKKRLAEFVREHPDAISRTYPLLQVGLVALVLLDRMSAAHVVGLLTLTAIIALFTQSSDHFDLLLRTVAFLTAAGLSLRLPDLPHSQARRRDRSDCQLRCLFVAQPVLGIHRAILVVAEVTVEVPLGHRGILAK